MGRPARLLRNVARSPELGSWRRYGAASRSIGLKAIHSLPSSGLAKLTAEKSVRIGLNPSENHSPQTEQIALIPQKDAKFASKKVIQYQVLE